MSIVFSYHRSYIVSKAFPRTAQLEQTLLVAKKESAHYGAYDVGTARTVDVEFVKSVGYIVVEAAVSAVLTTAP